MERLVNAYNLLEAIKPITNEMDFIIFGSMYCMLLEEWCKANDKDIIKYIQMINNKIKEVNEAEGRY